MSSDINIILQLLQRQLSQVPPAYSPISPSSHNLAMYGILPRSLEPLTPCAPLEDEETTTPEQVRPPLLAQHQPSFLLPQSRRVLEGQRFPSASLHAKHSQALMGPGTAQAS